MNPSMRTIDRQLRLSSRLSHYPLNTGVITDHNNDRWTVELLGLRSTAQQLLDAYTFIFAIFASSDADLTRPDHRRDCVRVVEMPVGTAVGLNRSSPAPRLVTLSP